METKLRFISFIIKRKQCIPPLDCRLPSVGWVLVLLCHLRNSNELLDLSAANRIFHSRFLFKCLKRRKKTAHAHFTSMFWRMSCTWASLEVILASCYSELPPALTFYKTIFIFPTTQKQTKKISVMFDLCHVTNKVTQEFCHSSLTTNIITKCQTLKGKFLNKMHYSAADDILHVWKLSRHTAFLRHLPW